MLRRFLLLLALSVSAFLSGPTRAAETFPVTVTDVVGRTVRLDTEPQRIILTTGRTILSMDIVLDEDLFDKVIAWRNDLYRNDQDTYQVYLTHFPKIKDLPEVGLISKGAFDLEYALTLNPDLLLLERSEFPVAKRSRLIETLEAAGIKTLFIDFKEDPLTHSVPSIRLLGQLFNKPKAADEYIRFFQKHLARIKAATASLPHKRRVFIEKAPGYNGLEQCCRTWGSTNFGMLAEAVGLVNIGSDLLPGTTGEISMEQLLIANPDLYVMTSSNWSTYRSSAAHTIPLGYGVSPSETQAGFLPLLTRPGFAVLDVTRDQQIYALFHQFFNGPTNIVAALFLAKWGYPEVYKTLDPMAELDYLHERFLTMPLTGTFGLQYQARAQ